MREFKDSVGKLVERVSNARLEEAKPLYRQSEIPVVIRQIYQGTNKLVNSDRRSGTVINLTACACA